MREPKPEKFAIVWHVENADYYVTELDQFTREQMNSISHQYLVAYCWEQEYPNKDPSKNPFRGDYPAAFNVITIFTGDYEIFA